VPLSKARSLFEGANNVNGDGDDSFFSAASFNDSSQNNGSLNQNLTTKTTSLKQQHETQKGQKK